MNNAASGLGGEPTASGSSGRLFIIMVVALFFIWGGLTSLNDILVPKLKDLYQLSYTEAMLTQFAFFAAYFVVSLPAGVLVARVGYLKGIVIGLAVMAIGCLMFIPAASQAIYAIFLAALFVLGAGITILQVAANPLIANLGSSDTSHSRLTLAQAFNSFGTTIFPFVGAQLMLGSITEADPSVMSVSELSSYRALEATVVSNSYLGIAICLCLIALAFWLQRSALHGQRAEATQPGLGLDLLKRHRLAFGVAAIFLYVGAEVSIGSVIVNYLMQADVFGIDEKSAGSLVALYWGGAMVGRFIGAGLLRLFPPGLVLLAAALGAATLALASTTLTGNIAGWTLLSIGLMNSIMFPTIFSLAIEGLGKRAPQGSGLLCMAIVGGAIVPVITGSVADASGLAVALLVPAVCYVMIAAFGWSARRPAVKLEEGEV